VRRGGQIPPAYVIGLTGNIASGKSVVAAMLAKLGAQVIDADQVARAVLEPGTPETARVLQRFGQSIALPDGGIDRSALGHIVFSNPQALRDLEAIVHPATRERIHATLENTNETVAVIEAIKLLEGPLVELADSIWVVTAPRSTRRARLIHDRGLDPETADQRIESQTSESQKVERSDVVIVNDGTLAQLQDQVEAAWSNLQAELARASSAVEAP
jgi:dephospho-CoA kinase